MVIRCAKFKAAAKSMDEYRPNINQISRLLKRDALSIKNRLQSIIYDSKFVESVASSINLPLIPNERCGLWYVPSPADSCYFKSTDGHTTQWSFSFRRLNLHLLPLLSSHNGLIIVDSTRKGKLMPDALLKTIPIWCAVINCILFDDESTNGCLLLLSELEYSPADLSTDGVSELISGNLQKLQLEDCDDDLKSSLGDLGATSSIPVHDYSSLKSNNWLTQFSEIISDSEFNSMVERIPGFVREVKRLGLFDKSRLLTLLGSKKPLVPIWYYPGKTEQDLNIDKFFTICCLTASKRINEQKITVKSTLGQGTLLQETKTTSWSYVQGSGDDHELWATNDICNGKLLPKLFWGNLYNGQIIDGDTKYIYDWFTDDELIEIFNSQYEDLLENDDGGVSLELVPVKTTLGDKVNDTNILLGDIKSDLHYNTLFTKFPNVKQLVILSKFKVTKVPPNSRYKVFSFNSVSNLLESENDSESTDSIFHINVDSSKKGSKQLRLIFPLIVPKLNINDNITIVCDDGKDLSAGFSVLLLCRYYDLNWELITDPIKINKDMVKKQLNLLGNVKKVNPSRNTLQSVNSFLMA